VPGRSQQPPHASICFEIPGIVRTPARQIQILSTTCTAASRQVAVSDQEHAIALPPL